MTFYRKKIVALLLFGILVFGVCGIFKYNSLKKNNDGKLEDAQIIFSKETGFYENEFELELSTPKGTIYYTLDGTKPDKNSIEYEKPILIRDASDNENIYSIRTDVSTGFWKEEIEKRSSGYPGYQIPEFKIDKSTIVRAVVYDELGRSSEVYSKSYFVGFSSKTGYENMKVLSIITEPENLFDYEKGIYVTGKTYDDYVKQYRESGIWEWREEFWGFWLANYRNAGIKWERKAEYHFFDENKNLVHEQRGGLRVHGGISRSYNPKSLNLYSRKEYDGNKKFETDLFETGYCASTITLFQGGNDETTKAKDYIVSEAIADLNVATMNYEPYVLFLNGEYWGVYWLNEKYDGKFFEYYYGVDSDNVIMIKSDELEEGEEEDFKYYTKMVEFCSQSDLTQKDNYERVCQLIDIDSYIDYYAIMCYVGRTDDWPWLNYGLWRTKKKESGMYGDGKWRWVIFDLNSPGFHLELDSIQYVMDNDEMFKNMMTNDNFRKQLCLKIEQLAQNEFSSDRINLKIEEYREFMTEPMKNHRKRFYNDDSLGSFHNGLDSLKYFFENRDEVLLAILEKYK